jgi:hypothetical protein
MESEYSCSIDADVFAGFRRSAESPGLHSNLVPSSNEQNGTSLSPANELRIRRWISKLTPTLEPSRLMTWLDRSESHIIVRSLTTDTNQSLGQRVEISEREWVVIGAEFVFIAYGGVRMATVVRISFLSHIASLVVCILESWLLYSISI